MIILLGIRLDRFGRFIHLRVAVLSRVEECSLGTALKIVLFHLAFQLLNFGCISFGNIGLFSLCLWKIDL